MASDVPSTYGIDANWGVVVVVVMSGFKMWGCLGWDIRSMAFLGYPLSSRDLTMVCCSLVLEEAVEGMVLAL